tara:strand:+ start:352 stop:510 length:159 start_codon:yes stop_codon:yes gene_type:complete
LQKKTEQKRDLNAGFKKTANFKKFDGAKKIEKRNYNEEWIATFSASSQRLFH